MNPSLEASRQFITISEENFTNIFETHLTDINEELIIDNYGTSIVLGTSWDNTNLQSSQKSGTNCLGSHDLKETCPNVENVLNIFLILPNLNAKEKYQLVTVWRQRLNNVPAAWAYIKSSTLTDVNYDELIDSFGTIKARSSVTQGQKFL